MHPAYSVILFTTASGAGYGLVSWIAYTVLTGEVQNGAALNTVAFGLGLLLIAGGLLSSTAHLGRPERAWRAFSQWQTSWLSREGVVALATFAPILLLAWAVIFRDVSPSLAALAAVLTIIGAGVTVYCTGMIYASLRTIPAWHRPVVAPIYIVLSLMTGGVLYCALMAAFGRDIGSVGWLTLLAIVASLALKAFYWGDIDTAPRKWTAEDATGLGRFGRVTPLEPPHTQPNFVMREMGYKVARKHADKLRWSTTLCLGIIPGGALLLALLTGGVFAVVLTLAAVISAAIGVLTERWLFFAEAKHIVTVYYEGGAV
ncbi:MAG: DmsC/YnfH family molybdoenzyme membrane anchor subunit [Pseudomonadota bacterium]